jgi:DnaJ-domain-containing protein 1
MEEEGKLLEDVPDDDSDILGKYESQAEPGLSSSKKGDGNVAETHYYDILEVEPSADAGQIKRKYYLLARTYHPDKVGADDVEAGAYLSVVLCRRCASFLKPMNMRAQSLNVYHVSEH